MDAVSNTFVIPEAPAFGVPDMDAVPLPLLNQVNPFGRAELPRVGVGEPVVDTRNKSGLPTVAVSFALLVNPGALLGEVGDIAGNGVGVGVGGGALPMVRVRAWSGAAPPMLEANSSTV
ncbi:MAG TPA: hypothetical protein VEJ84_14235, partial [Acidimicrobiales bacterium]|nr:hypothetical protein [Acidimicrobiales bacterium]